MKTKQLFDREFVIAPDGIYTFAYLYQHPKTNLRVILLGMNHIGERKYFDEARKILSQCDTVIFEGVKPHRWKEYIKIWNDIDKILDRKARPIDKLLGTNCKKFWEKIRNRIRWVAERRALRENKTHWICGDEQFWLNLRKDKNLAAYAKRVHRWRERLSKKYKHRLLLFYRRKLSGLKKNKWSKQDLGEYYITIIDNLVFGRYCAVVLGYKREQMVMEKFDKIRKQRKTRCIAIKFGAAHIARFRKQLENRGFVCSKIIKLCNFSF